MTQALFALKLMMSSWSGLAMLCSSTAGLQSVVGGAHIGCHLIVQVDTLKLPKANEKKARRIGCLWHALTRSRWLC